LQVFHMDVAKVELDIAYVAIVSSKCFMCVRYLIVS
jgi:hypothetical protein